MARGGIHDQVGGGFHRYSVDAQWTVPHFEKMLYDNALLVRAYLTAWRATGQAEFRQVAESTFAFLRRELQDPRGAFWSSLDADSEGEEGRFYTWTPTELIEGLGELDAGIAQQAFGITSAGHVDGRSVATMVSIEGQETQREGLRLRLLALRDSRPRPATDDKVVASWNGLALIAWSEAAQAWGRVEELTTAQRLGAFLLDDLSPDGRLLRSERHGRHGPYAFLEDHAAVGLGLLSLYQTDFDERWFNGAAEQAQAILRWFVGPEQVLYDTPSDHEALLTRPRSYQDSPTPSGAAMAAELMMALHALTGEDEFARLPPAFLASTQELAAQHPTSFGAALANLQAWTVPPRQLAVVGNPADPLFLDLVGVARAGYWPRLVVAGGQATEDPRVPLLRDRKRIGDRSTAYFCENFTCKAPTSDAQELLGQMERRSSDANPSQKG
jgi:uncharacterized protein YyaL (SSP411 family)